jgi:hypothetical protein
MAGELLVSIVIGAMVAVLALYFGTGVVGGVVAYSSAGALWLTSGLLTGKRRR